MPTEGIPVSLGRGGCQNNNADSFIDNTFNADVTTDIHSFIKKVKPGGKILDVGCGSGRDTLIFKNLGFNVTAFDVSEELVKKASEKIKAL